ncbi:MAG TPA: helix-turn-helix domain-containing protein [Plantibacter sp.]|uniref:PucR family transcriptional regulator n=1 Tax=unclassified Plantibacter TaxID=2624265 RepID=UPI002D109996|nr:helix-turn-helix domain-containing protein [Plantibacter sp.]
MARDLDSIVRTLGATLLGGPIAGTAPIDQLLPIADLAVRSHPAFTSIVTATVPEIQAVLGADDQRRAALRAAAVVVPAPHSPSETALLGRLGLTVLWCEDDLERTALRIDAILAGDQAAEDRLVATGTRVLTQVARRGGVGAIVAELASRIDGWVVLLDDHGQTISSAGAGALHVQDAAAVAFNRPVRIRHTGLQVHPVGLGEDLAAHLVVASREGGLSRVRSLASQAAALLDLVLRTHDHSVAERLGRDLMVDTLLGGDPGRIAELLAHWGVREVRLAAFTLSSRSKTVDVERVASRWFDELGCAQIMTVRHGVLTGFLREDRVPDLVERVEAFAATAAVPMRLGVGESASIDTLARSARQSAQAHQASGGGRFVVHYRALPTVGFVFARLDEAATAELQSVLDPLLEDGAHGELTETLRRYLVEDGSWGITAQALGIHRQTLRSRMGRIEELTGLSMADPDDRAAAWLALRALEH